MEGGTYAEEAEAEDWQLIFALDAVRRTETHANTGGMLMPVVLAGAEPTIIMARRVPTTAATCVR